MITIDGSMGEGGGQILRTALGLSLVTGKRFCIENIRAGRAKPGLMRQHLTAVRAAAQISNACIVGDEIGSLRLEFEPGPVIPGDYEFAVGTAGSATLVFQTVLQALMIGPAPSKLTLKGGTHNPWAPPFDFLDKTLLPLLNRMACPERSRGGPTIAAKLVRPGFYPAGGGEFVVSIQPSGTLGPLDLTERGEIVARHGRAVVARLSEQIARRELKVVTEKLGWSDDQLSVEQSQDSAGPGNVLLLEVQSRHVTEVFTGFGQLDRAAEAVARDAVDQCRRYLAAEVPVGEHLADQLLVPLALSAVKGAGSTFRTLDLTRHARTNIDVIQKFMDVQIRSAQIARHVWEIDVRKSGGAQ